METFKDYEFRGLNYKISDKGNVYGKKGEVKQRLSKDGYKQVTLGKEDQRTSVLVHRIVAEIFIPNPLNLPEVNHKDYDRANASFDNLEWISHSDNVSYSANNGNYKNNTTGVKNGRAKYSVDEITKIRKLYDSGYGVMDIIKELFPHFDYKQRKSKWTRVKDICLRNTYSNIDEI